MDQLFHRKAKAAVRFLDAKHQPLVHQQISAKLIDHKFLFGCGAFEAIPFAKGLREGQDQGAVTEEMKQRQTQLSDRMEKWLDLFNYGTLPFYWGHFEPQEGKPETEAFQKAAAYLHSRDVIMKGHPLCWQTVGAQWLLQYDDETILKKQIDRVRREVESFRGTVDIWDVINEAVIMPVYDRYDNAATRLCKMLGRVRLIRMLFEEAHQANPDAVLILNDFDLSQRYEILIDGCLNAGVPLHAIGIQSHQHQGIWGKDKTEEVLYRLETFGLPIHFTENTIVAGPLVSADVADLQDAHYEDGAATPEYEQMQADELEKMYRLLFEHHPLVEAITNWDFGDGAWLNAPSGVIRKDGSLKPAYHRLRRLVKEEWITDTSVTTDDYGVAVLEGFKGKYLLTCGERQTACLLTDDQPEVTVAFG